MRVSEVVSAVKTSYPSVGEVDILRYVRYAWDSVCFEFPVVPVAHMTIIASGVREYALPPELVRLVSSRVLLDSSGSPTYTLNGFSIKQQDASNTKWREHTASSPSAIGSVAFSRGKLTLFRVPLFSSVAGFPVIETQFHSCPAITLDSDLPDDTPLLELLESGTRLKIAQAMKPDMEPLHLRSYADAVNRYSYSHDARSYQFQMEPGLKPSRIQGR